MRALVEQMDREFEELWSPTDWFAPLKSTASPLLNRPGASGLKLEETPQAYVVTADLPGMEKEDIHVDVRGDAVAVRAERREDRKDRKGRTRTLRSFHQSLVLPAPVRRGEAKAQYRNGVLRVELPKQAESRATKVAIG